MKRLLFLILSAITVVSVNGHNTQESIRKLYDKGVYLLSKGDTVQAMRLYKKAAKAGLADAQCSLGTYLILGKGVKKDTKQGLLWLNKSAIQNNPIASYILGILYYHGDTNVPRDSVQAYYWMDKAAQTGHFTAQICLGDLYVCEKQDTVTAISYYLMADRQVKETYILSPGEKKYYALKQRCDVDELARIDFALGYYYHTGIGVKRNYDTAFDYYRSAALFGNSEASFYLGKLYYYGSQVFQLEKNDKLAAYYMQMAAEKGHTEAQLFIADFYMTGTGLERDSIKAISWYKQAAEAGNADAQYALAYYYNLANDNDSTIFWGTKPLCRMFEGSQYLVGNAYYKKGEYDNAELWWKKAAKQNNAEACWELACLYDNEKKDSIASFIYLKKAAELGHVSSIGNIGINYFYGYSVPKDEEKGIDCFKTAAMAGDANACLNLGNIYYWKEYGRKNYQLAAEYWKQGAEMGSPECQYNYGMLLRKGRGVKKNKEEAVHWLKLAADNGLDEAKEEMKKI